MASRKPRPESPLDRAELVTHAIAVADAEGLAAVSLRRLARDHDVTPMALYWHFREKDQLYDAIAERLLAGVVLPPRANGDDGTWDSELRAVLAAYLDAIRPHPAVVGLAYSRILRCAPGLDLAERVLAVLAAAGFGPEQAADVGSHLLASVISLVTAEPGPSRALDDETRDAEVRATRAGLLSLSPATHPHVVASADALADCRSEAAYFASGIDLLVAGVRGLAAVAATY